LPVCPRVGLSNALGQQLKAPPFARNRGKRGGDSGNKKSAPKDAFKSAEY